jgi:hypothetical protein
MWSIAMRQRDISWTTATSGFVFLALMLAGEGFLFSMGPDDQSAVTQSRSAQAFAWEGAMKAFSRHAHDWRQP